MGLSDKERTEIIFEGINALVTRSIRFEDECGDKGLLGTGVGNRILIEVKDLWRKILKINNNSSFWILGGDLRNVKSSEPTLWSAVVSDGLKDHSECENISIEYVG
jgi:hypothetical protein